MRAYRARAERVTAILQENGRVEMLALLKKWDLWLAEQDRNRSQS